jgi:hypothetical protein
VHHVWLSHEHEPWRLDPVVRQPRRGCRLAAAALRRECDLMIGGGVPPMPRLSALLAERTRGAASQLVTALSARHAPTSRWMHARVSRPPPSPQGGSCRTSKFLRRARILEDDVIHLERSEVACSVPIDGICDMVNESAQLSVVILSDHRAGRLSLRLAGHVSEATHEPCVAHFTAAKPARWREPRGTGFEGCPHVEIDGLRLVLRPTAASMCREPVRGAEASSQW